MKLEYEGSLHVCGRATTLSDLNFKMYQEEPKGRSGVNHHVELKEERSVALRIAAELLLLLC
jgi:hypothetical protein